MEKPLLCWTRWTRFFFCAFWHRDPKTENRNQIESDRKRTREWLWGSLLFAPQRRALFQHLNFQKCCKPGVLCAFWLRNALRAATACILKHLNFQKCPENGAPCTLWLWLALHATTACNFSSFTSSPLFYLFARLHLVSSDSFSSLPSLAFHLPILAEAWLLKIKKRAAFKEIAFARMGPNQTYPGKRRESSQPLPVSSFASLK